MRNISITFVFFLSLSFSACQKFLDVVPDNIPTLDDAFADRISSERYLATCYSYLPKPGTFDDLGFMGGDDVWYHSGDNVRKRHLDLAMYGNNITDTYWNFWGGSDGGTPFWKAIRECNTFIENIHKARDLDDFERARWIAEVKVLKAWYHFYLMRVYGPIPIMRQNLPISVSQEETKIYREPIDDVVNYIVSLLDEAIPDLPSTIEDLTAEAGRVSQPVASSIKALVLVTAASPMFNGNKDYLNFKDERGRMFFNPEIVLSKWEKATAACKDAIAVCHLAGIQLYKFNSSFSLSDQTKLILTPGQVVTDKFNSERIWSLSHFKNDSKGLQAYTAPRLHIDHRTIIWPRIVPTLKMAELYYSSNGIPIEEDKTYDYNHRYDIVDVPDNQGLFMQRGYPTAKLHLNRESRFYGSLAIDGGLWFGFGRNNENQQWPLSFYLGSISGGRMGLERYSVTTYYIKKLSHYLSTYSGSGTGTTFIGREFDFPLLRLSDLYLLYSEALNESLSSPSQDVFYYIDLVRNRAGLKGVKESWDNYSKFGAKYSTQDGMREIIRQERNIELAFEGHRFWDVRRWKKAVEYYNQPIQGWNTEGTKAEEFYQVIDYNRKSYTLRDVLWPIPQNEMLKNNNLIQNPGW